MAEYERYFSGEALVQLAAEVPEVRDIAESHCCSIGGFWLNASGDRVVINATIDNLLKGAATQAMQNLNLVNGFDELDGIVKTENESQKKKTPEITL